VVGGGLGGEDLEEAFGLVTGLHGIPADLLAALLRGDASNGLAIKPGRSSSSAEAEARLVTLMEQRLDAFQLATTQRWHWLLRATSSIVAGLLLMTAAAGASWTAGFNGLFLGAALGLVVGGPVAWALRDLIRLVESRVDRG